MKRVITELIDWAPLLVVLTLIFIDSSEVKDSPKPIAQATTISEQVHLCIEDTVLYQDITSEAIQWWNAC